MNQVTFRKYTQSPLHPKGMKCKVMDCTLGLMGIDGYLEKNKPMPSIDAVKILTPLPKRVSLHLQQ